MVQQAFKQFAQWPLEDCVMKFYEKLSPICRFDIERFPCALGVYTLVQMYFGFAVVDIYCKLCM